jgi:hypothetical protein
MNSTLEYHRMARQTIQIAEKTVSVRGLVGMEDTGNIFLGNERIVSRAYQQIVNNVVRLQKADLQTSIHIRVLGWEMPLGSWSLHDSLAKAGSAVYIWTTPFESLLRGLHLNRVVVPEDSQIIRQGFYIVDGPGYARALIVWGSGEAALRNGSYGGVLVTSPDQSRNIHRRLSALLNPAAPR